MSEFEDVDRKFSKQAGLCGVIGTATDSSQAATINSRYGTVTSSTTTLAADTVETLTITCSECKSTSIVLANVRGGGAAAGALSVCATPGAGSFTLGVRNNTSATAADAAYVVDYVIISSNV